MTITIGLCDLCGSKPIPIRHALVAWINPAFGPFGEVDRCVDAKACHQRVEDQGVPWPVIEPAYIQEELA
jgi:hypothetical protein